MAWSFIAGELTELIPIASAIVGVSALSVLSFYIGRLSVWQRLKTTLKWHLPEVARDEISNRDETIRHQNNEIKRLSGASHQLIAALRAALLLNAKTSDILVSTENEVIKKKLEKAG